MSTRFESSNSGSYTDYSNLLAFYDKARKECPKGVSLKLQNNKYLLLQFIFPNTGKRSSKSCNVKFTYSGIEQAVQKTHKVSKALKTFKTASEFWTWYDKEILGVSQIENDLKTYREIFDIIEARFWQGRNKNTKRKRSKDIPNDVASFNRQYGCVFKRFSALGISLDGYPNWGILKSVWFSWSQGTKQFKMVKATLRQIAELSANSKELLKKIDNIDATQYDFKELQSISIDDFLTWYNKAYSEIESIKNKQQYNARKSWLWVAAMCVVYGLRPTEIAAAKNLTKSITIDGQNFPSINDPSNRDLLLVLADFTYFGISIKTGGRVVKPMCLNRKILEKLHIFEPNLPAYNPSSNAKSESIVCGFDRQFADRMKSYKLPITQKYAFRHLSNQLGELYGIPQEIRARSLGHSVAVNDSIYKKRSNIKTIVDLFTKHSKQPLFLELAKQQLESLGIVIDDSVKTILKVVYQLDESLDLL